MLLAFNQHVPVPILSGCRPVPYVGSHAIDNHSRNSENRRHCLNVPSVEPVHVPAHCVHRFFHGQSSSCFWARNMNERGSRIATVVRLLPADALFPVHCIWSSMFENAALSLSAFLISSALT